MGTRHKQGCRPSGPVVSLPIDQELQNSASQADLGASEQKAQSPNDVRERPALTSTCVLIVYSLFFFFLSFFVFPILCDIFLAISRAQTDSFLKGVDCLVRKENPEKSEIRLNSFESGTVIRVYSKFHKIKSQQYCRQIKTAPPTKPPNPVRIDVRILP